MNQDPIGIFDSGIGGLTVLREIAKILPHEDLLYLGDTARVPYGTKSADTVRRYAFQNAKFLLKEKVKAIVVACNTASAFALEDLQKEFSIPILGVVEPGAVAALRITHSRRIGVIGTEGTVDSGTYEKHLLQREPGVFVSSAPCPLFVPLIEEGWWEGDIAEEIARTYLKDMRKQNIDALILGCTHYPLLKKTIAKVMGPSISLIDSAEETARSLSQLLAQRHLMRTENKNPRREYFVTDSPERFRRLGRLFLDTPLKDVRHVEI